MHTWSQLSFSNPISPFIWELTFLNNYFNIIICAIGIAVIWSLLATNIQINKITLYNTYIIKQRSEMRWTIYPSIILIAIAIPRIQILYYFDENIRTIINIKFIGHQWYWEYENLQCNENYDIYINKNRLIQNIDTNNIIYLPYRTKIQTLVTSADVLHSFRIPVLGIKIDCCPGRIHNTIIECIKPGIIYGQCSEICGANHRFIPFKICFINIKKYIEMLD